MSSLSLKTDSANFTVFTTKMKYITISSIHFHTEPNVIQYVYGTAVPAQTNTMLLFRLVRYEPESITRFTFKLHTPPSQKFGLDAYNLDDPH